MCVCAETMTHVQSRAGAVGGRRDTRQQPKTRGVINGYVNRGVYNIVRCYVQDEVF